MKKIKKILFLYFYCFLLWGCQNSRKNTDEDKIRILYFSREKNLYQENNVWEQIAEGMEEEGKQYNNLLLSIYKQSDERRIWYDKQIDIAINMETDVLVAHGMNSQIVKEKYKELHEAGVSLVLLDGDVPESGRILYIGTDNKMEGKRAALLALEKIKGNIYVGILDEQRDNIKNPVASLSGREEGFLEIAKEQERLEIKVKETGLTSLLKAKKGVEKILEQYPEINLLFCNDSITGQAAAEIVKEKKLSGKVHIICFDITKEIGKKIQEGIIDFTLVQQMKEAGKICVQELAMQEENEFPKEIYLDCIVVTDENVEEYLM